MALTSTSVVALSRETLRGQMITSMFGRRAGIDIRGFEVGEEDTRLPIDNITTTAASSLLPNGFSLLSSTPASAATYTLLTPVSGIYKQITQISSSTLGFTIQFGANANIVTSAGSSFNQMVLAGVGHTASLSCVSTSTATGPIWVSASVASPGITFSTY